MCQPFYDTIAAGHTDTTARSTDTSHFTCAPSSTNTNVRGGSTAFGRTRSPSSRAVSAATSTARSNSTRTRSGWTKADAVAVAVDSVRERPVGGGVYVGVGVRDRQRRELVVVPCHLRRQQLCDPAAVGEAFLDHTSDSPSAEKRAPLVAIFRGGVTRRPAPSPPRRRHRRRRPAASRRAPRRPRPKCRGDAAVR